MGIEIIGQLRSIRATQLLLTNNVTEKVGGKYPYIYLQTSDPYGIPYQE